MAQKQLSIIVAAVDKATAPLRGVANTVGVVGNAAATADKKTTGFLSGIGKMLGGIKGLVAGLAGGYTIYAAARGLHALTGELDALDDQSAKLGVTVETLSRLKYIAQLSGGDFESMAEGVGKFNEALGQFMATGRGRSADAFRRLGVNLRDSSGAARDVNELLPEVIDAIGAVDDAYEQAYLTQKLFGNSDFLIWIRAGGDALRKMSGEAERLGVVYTKAQTEAASLYRDAFDRIGFAWDGLGVRIIDAIGPSMTEMFNWLAGAIAAIPAIVGRTVGTVRDAFGFGAAADEAREKLAELGESAAELIGKTVLGGLRIALAAVGPGVDAITGVIDQRWERWGDSFVDRIPMFISRSYNRAGFALSEVLHEAGLLTDAMFEKDKRILKERLDGLDALAAEAKLRAREGLKGPGATDAGLMDALGLTHLEGSEFMRVLAAVKADVAAAAGRFGNAADNVTGFNEALAQTRVDIDGLIPRLGSVGAGLKEAEKATWRWSDALAGVERGWDAITRAANDAAAWGTKAVTEVTQTISVGLSDAFLDSISGITSWGEAFRAWGARTMRTIADVISQMLILRLVTGAVNGLAGAFGGAAAVPAPGSGMVATPPGIIGSVHYNKGGWAGLAGAGVLMAAAGAWVPGAGPNRDTVPAMLTTRERVLSREEVSRMGGPGAVDAAARGGGGGIVIQTTINVSGGGGSGGGGGGGVDTKAIERAATAGVLRALEQNPAVRARMRGALA